MTSLNLEPHKARLDSLTGLRFYAAIVVLARHAVPEFFPAPVLAQLAAIGPIGVGFFFTLSGFILTWTRASSGSTRAFYGRRFARIYPLHLLTTIIAVAYLVAIGNPQWFSDVMSVLLLQAWGPDTWRLGGNGPSWSLSVEAFFYLMFPLLVPLVFKLSRRGCAYMCASAVLAMVVWTGLYALATLADLPFVTALSPYTNPLYRMGEFVIGMCIAAAMLKGWRVSLPFPLVGGVAILGYVGLAAVNAAVVAGGLRLGSTVGLPLGILDLVFLPVTCLLIAGAASTDLRGGRTALKGPIHIRLGEWSFALYLVQMIVIVPFAALWRTDEVGPAGLVALIVTCIACQIAAAFLFHAVEQPAERALRRRIGVDRPQNAGRTSPGQNR